MFYTLYKTTNTLDGKVYIGVHKTENPYDDYLGSGKYLNLAVKKHGREYFTKEILETFSTPEMAYQLESIIVNKDFVRSKDTYNLKEGGYGGFSHLNDGSSEHVKRCVKAGKLAVINMNNTIAIKRLDPDYEIKYLEKQNTFNGKTHSDETKKKIGEANSKHQKGTKNSQYGTMWIYNPKLKENKKIPKGIVPDGWLRGRKMKWAIIGID